MAKQNFIQGGFTGKLGATIGQGWKNIKVIRSGFIPANPRTPKQQANRSVFSDCVKLAQLAMQMDWKSLGFQSESNTEWANRIQSARKYYDKEKNFLYAIPLIPYGTVAKYEVSDTFNVAGGVVTFHITSSDDLSGRNMSVLLWLKKTGQNVFEPIISQSTVQGSAGDWTFTASVPTGYEIDTASLACACSNDDVALNTKIYRSTFSIGKQKEHVSFTLSLGSITPIASGATSRVVTLTPSITLPQSAEITATATGKGVLQGKWVTNPSGNIVLSGGNIVATLSANVLDTLSQLVQFPVGSEITIPAFSFSDDDYIYEHTAQTIALSETVVQQTATTDETEFKLSGDRYYMIVKSGVTGTYNGSKTGTISAYLDEDGVDHSTSQTPVSLVARDGDTCFTIYGKKYNEEDGIEIETDNATVTMVLNGVTYSLPAGIYTIESAGSAILISTSRTFYEASQTGDDEAEFYFNPPSTFVFYEDDLIDSVQNVQIQAYKGGVEVHPELSWEVRVTDGRPLAIAIYTSDGGDIMDVCDTISITVSFGAVSGEDNLYNVSVTTTVTSGTVQATYEL